MSFNLYGYTDARDQAREHYAPPVIQPIIQAPAVTEGPLANLNTAIR